MGTAAAKGDVSAPSLAIRPRLREKKQKHGAGSTPTNEKDDRAAATTTATTVTLRIFR